MKNMLHRTVNVLIILSLLLSNVSPVIPLLSAKAESVPPEDSTETSSGSTLPETGSGSEVNPPVVVDMTFEINNGDEKTGDTDLEITIAYLQDDGFVPVKMKVSQFEDLHDAEWEVFQPSIIKTISDVAGTYTFYAKMQDIDGLETIIYSDSIDYVHYNFKPELNLEFIEAPLLGGDVLIYVDFKNDGSEVGYNASLELGLPEGVEYIEAVQPEYTEFDPVFPTYISPEKVRWESFTDLLPGETYTAAFRLKIPGMPTYYIGDLFKLKVNAYLYESPLSSYGGNVTEEAETPIQAFRIERSDIHPDEQVTGEYTYSGSGSIIVRSNPIISSNEYVDTGSGSIILQPVVIRQILDSGIEYIPNSQKILNINNDEYSFNSYKGSLDQNSYDPAQYILEWLFNSLTPFNYENPVEASYSYTIPYAERDGVLDDGGDTNFNNHGAVITDDARYDTNAEVNAYFPTRSSENEEIDITGTGSVISRYIKIEKYPDKYEVNPGDIVTFNVDIDTSDYYNFASLYLDDQLPDGLKYLSTESDGTAYINSGFPVINPDGTTDLQWKITSLPHSSHYTFAYKVEVQNSYVDLSDVVSNDYFHNTVKVDGIWGDVVDIGRTGEDGDSDMATVRTPRPVMNVQAWDEADGKWVEQVDARIGDQVKLKLDIQFPDQVPTNDVKLTNFIPPYTEITGSGSIIFDHTGSFENDPTVFETASPLTATGSLFDFGDVGIAADWSAEYTVKIDESEYLRNGVLLRNLSRLDYQNASETKRVELEKAAIRIVEPNINVTKRKLSGYLGAGETVQIEVKVENIGTSPAFDVNIDDGIFDYVTYGSGSLITNGICDIANLGLRFTNSTGCTVNPGEPFIYTYLAEVDADVVTNTKIASDTQIAIYYNRDASDTLFRKTYNAEEFNFEWSGVEGALVTGIKITDLSDQLLVGIPRGKDFKIVFNTRNVGGSPVYELAVPILTTLDLTGDEFTLLSSDIPALPVTLNPGEEYKQTYTYHSILDLPVGKDYLTEISAEGKNALGELIRKDTSSEITADLDNDDFTSYNYQAIGDTEAPMSFILFKDGSDNYVDATNDLNDVYFEYSALDIAQPQESTSGIKAVRFSNDGINWDTIPALPLGDDCGPWLTCNEWDGSAFKVLNNFDNIGDGTYTTYMQVMDNDENIGSSNSSIVLDTIATSTGSLLVWIGPEEYDTENPEYTGNLSNYVTYIATGDDGTSIDSVQFSTDGITFSDWQDYYEDDFNSFSNTWANPNFDGTLEIFMRVRDSAGNVSDVVNDTIKYLPNIVTVALDVKALGTSADDYTRSNVVNGYLTTTNQNSDLTITESRFRTCYGVCSDQDAWGEWENYENEVTKSLAEGGKSGQKTLCVQVRDIASNVSNESCDSIIQDFTVPVGSVTINGGVEKTTSQSVILNLSAQDPKLEDGNNGVGGINFRVSKDVNIWSDWTDLASVNYSHSIQLDKSNGQAIVYVQYKDKLGNESAIYQDSINVDSTKHSSASGDRVNGSIQINNNDLFTETEIVTLQILSSTSPDYMKIWNEGDDSSLAVKEKYQTVKHWTLNNSEVFGIKRVYIQFFKGTEESATGYDEIILAPKYSIEYISTPSPNIGEGQGEVYTLSTIPQSALASDILNVVLDVKNTGSVTWMPQSEEALSNQNPVNISYHWYYSDGKTVYQPNGNRGILNKTVAFGESDQQINLPIYTPVVPGEYVLKIDAVHEGVLWFSDVGNKMPEFRITVGDNPEFPYVGNDEGKLEDNLTPTDQTQTTDAQSGVLGTSTLGEGFSNGIGGTAYYTIQPARPWDPSWRCWGYDCLSGIAKEYYGCSTFSCWNPIYEANRHLWDGVYIPPEYYSNPWNYLQVGWKLVLPNVPDTWDARLNSQSHNGNITLKQGEAVIVEARYENVGTATWSRSFINLGTQSPQDRQSIFATTWKSPTRTGSYDENVDVMPNGVVSFRFKFSSSSELAAGSYRECFAPVAESRAWMNDDIVCWNVNVVPRQLPVGNIFCTEGTDVYDSINGAVVGNLPYNSTVTILSESGIWRRIELDGNNNRWIKSECFDQTGSVDNGEQTSTDVSFVKPTGDEGVIISTVPLKLRFGPSLKFGWEVEVPFGTPVRVLRQTIDDSEGLAGWYEVELADGRAGWVPKGYVDLAEGYNPTVWTPPRPDFSESHICNGDVINLRMAPNMNSRIITTMTANTNLRVVDVVGEWYYVTRMSGMSGYVHKSYVCEGFIVPAYNSGQTSTLDGVQFNYPFNGNYQVTSGYGERWGGFHNGTDYGLPCGTDLFAVADGTVASIGTNGIVLGNASNGSTPANYVIINHVNGWRSLYWHMSTVAVERGQPVSRGGFIGKSGNTGYVRGSTGCHLHLEIQKNGVAKDPEWVLNYQPEPVILPPGEDGQQSEDYYSNPFEGIDEEEVDVEPDFGDVMYNLIESFKRDAEATRWDFLAGPKMEGYFLWGVLQGAVGSVWDTIKLVWDLLTKFGDTWKQIWDSISAIWNDPSILKYLLYDKIDEFAAKDIYGKMEMVGKIVGPFILDILLALLAGAGVAKFIGGIATKLKTAISSLRITAKIAAFANKVKTIFIAGVKLLVEYGEKALVKIKSLWNSIKNLGIEQIRKILAKLPISLKQKAYLLIKYAGGKTDDVIRYSVKESGEVTWLDNGIGGAGDDAYGWIHILQKHYPDYVGGIGKGTLFPKVPFKEIKDLMFEVVGNTTPYISKGNLVYERMVTFSDGTKKVLRVVTDSSGKILSSYPI